MTLDLPDAQLDYDPGFLTPDAADMLFDGLVADIPWRHDHITLYGKTHAVPRLQQWFADDGIAHTYSRIRMEPAPWPERLDALRQQLALRLGHPFNSCLANLYRDGSDSNGWHADDEPEFGVDPVIASVSLGSTRTFRLRHNETRQTHGVDLTHGSLLVMSGPTQRYWQHTIPKRKRVDGPRLNLTFRLTAPVE